MSWGRNLTDDMKAMIQIKYKARLAEDGLAAMAEGGGDKISEKAKKAGVMEPSHPVPRKPTTRKKLAKQAGLSIGAADSSFVQSWTKLRLIPARARRLPCLRLRFQQREHSAWPAVQQDEATGGRQPEAGDGCPEVANCYFGRYGHCARQGA